jgi:bifunctional enzyme CysN/CysC
VAGGVLRIGDAVTVAGTGEATTIDRLLGPAGDLDTAAPGTPVTVVLKGDVDVHRGDVLVPAGGDTPALTTALTATVVWTGADPLEVGAGYLLQAGPRSVPAEVTTLRARLDVETGQDRPANTLSRNEIGTVDVTIAAPVFLESYVDNQDTGSFLLVDRRTGDTVGAGMVRKPTGRPDVVPQDYAIDRTAREQLKGRRGKVVWLTGLPGAGKSTIADALERRLHGLGVHTYVLDGDNVRGRLNRDLGFNPADRAENVRRVAEVAALMLDAGLTVIVALVSPFRADRAAARNLFAPGDFVEVWVDTPLAECARRDPKGLYARANSGSLPSMTGMGQNYESPEAADIVLDGTGPIDQAVARLVTAITG